MDIRKTSFAETYARACERKGGEKVVRSLLSPEPSLAALRETTDDRVLSMMAKCVFRAGFNWQVIEKKWPGFEEAFLGFDPGRLHFQPDEFWDDLTSNKAIVRHGAKIKSVRDNAAFVLDLAKEHGSFGHTSSRIRPRPARPRRERRSLRCPRRPLRSRRS
ncbi:MAG: DNA-3-methyladenine glycosylase I, partial [Pseudomonadota bacterium]